MTDTDSVVRNDLICQTECHSSEVKAPPLNRAKLRPTVESIRSKNPELDKFFELNRMKKVATNSTDCFRALQDAVLSTAKSYNLITQVEGRIKRRESEITETIRALIRQEINYDIKIILYLKYKQNLKMCKAHRRYINNHKMIIQNLTEIANIIQIEKQPFMMVIHTDVLNESINRNPDYSLYENHKRMLSQIIKDASKDMNSKVFARMQEVFAACDTYFNQDFGFIDDDGLKDFQNAVELTSPNFRAGLRAAIQRIQKVPADCGTEIVNLSKSFIEITGVTHYNILRYLFLMFTRLVFNRIYISRFDLEFRSPDFSFQIKIKRLRKRKPSDFPPSLKFLPKELHDIRIKDFPIENLYRKCAEDIQFVQFETSPIDFCMACYKCLEGIQIVASNVLEKSNTDLTKEKDAFALSFDDLFDITVVVLLLALPTEIHQIIVLITPFVEGLKVSPQLMFGFMVMKSACEHILSTETQNDL